LADVGRLRKKLLFLSTAICIAATSLLVFPKEGQILFALSCFVLANIFFELANVFYNAFLPDIAQKDQTGRISGYGWALGYLGGLFCLLIALTLFISPDIPILGISKEGGLNIRATNLLVALWFSLFSLPLFFFVRDPPKKNRAQDIPLLKTALRQLGETLSRIRRYQQIIRLLIARLIYNDGLITIFAFGGIYAAGTFDFEIQEVIVFGIVLNLSAAIGAWLMGYVDDHIGGQTTILLSLAGLTICSLIAATTNSRDTFWIVGAVIGFLAGPTQSASRSLLARFAPPDKRSEFFGFFAFSGKCTAFLGPLLLGLLTRLFENQRAGIAIIPIFFIVGGLLLLRVNEQQGIARSKSDSLTNP
jgi:UMF1 family MFS transporter